METGSQFSTLARTCRNGHSNTTTNAFCGTCGERLTPTGASNSAETPAFEGSAGVAARPAPAFDVLDALAPEATGISGLVMAGVALGLLSPLVRLALFQVEMGSWTNWWPIRFGFSPNSVVPIDFSVGSVFLETSALGVLSVVALLTAGATTMSRSAKAPMTARVIGVGLLVLSGLGVLMQQVLGFGYSDGSWSGWLALLLVEVVPAGLILAGGISAASTTGRARPILSNGPPAAFARSTVGSAYPPPTMQGAPGPVAMGYTPAETSTSDGTAVASLILSTVGLVLCGPLAIVGLVLGYSARKRIHQSGGQIGGAGLATASIVVGWIAIVLWVLLTIGYLALSTVAYSSF